jgi:predicted lipoprotein
MLRRPLALAVTAALLLAACGDDEPSRPTATATVEEGLVTIADVIVEGYEDLDASLTELTAAIEALCASPTTEALDEARLAWLEASTAFRLTSAGGIGPATDQRLNTSLGFLARPDDIDELLASTELALFADGSDTLTTADGARRCEYATSVAMIAEDAAASVLDSWTSGYQEELVDAMDSQEALMMIVEEVSHRLTELDDQGLRTMTEAESLDELTDNRQDGPAAHRMAELRALLAGVQRIVGDDDADDPRLLGIVVGKSQDTADRLDDTLREATEAMGVLPDSVTESFGTDELTTAQEAVAALDVLLSTEVASQLGVTIGFSDADGDS